MLSRLLPVVIGLSIVLLGGCSTMNGELDVDAEKAEISKVIHGSIGWAANKDKELVFGCFADDPELFYFSPRDDGTIHGYKAFVDLTEGFFMLDDFKAVRYEIRELSINLSRSGDVAWYHARLDDFNEWKGQPVNWEDVRWTGVLEKRDGRWVIVQMHFSDASDKKG
ncbi:MAG: nuclear transport factor 2 family protein [Candidatus Zixiibacteriota bacterium]|nr:MAG: nuclear transport factor 2 family protein [candidate division Zixibacteria bacterium]